MGNGSWKADLRYAVKEMAGVNNLQSKLLAAEVVSVDVATRTCVVTVLSGETEFEIPNVQLQASADDGFILFPAVESTVYVSNEDKMPCCVVMYSEISKVLAIQDAWQFNDGKNKGLVKVVELTTKINNLEKLLNDLITKYNSHTHVYVPGTLAPIATATPIPTETDNITPITSQSDIENTKVTH